MPFGLCNAPATFKRLMECVLWGLTWKTCLVYLNDIIVLGETFNQHLENLREIFMRLQTANLRLNIKKCRLFAKEVNYKGHVISSNGVRTNPSKVEMVKNWPVPKDKHRLRSFLVWLRIIDVLWKILQKLQGHCIISQKITEYSTGISNVTRLLSN